MSFPILNLTKDKELSAFVPASNGLPKPLTLKRLSVSSDTLKKRPHDSNASSSSTTLNHPSLSHPLDDIVDVNDEESFRSISSSPSQNISSSSNVVYDDHRKGLRSIGKTLKDMMSGRRK
ncbi:hypothetical protein Tco_0592340 [Tanacetum coccineum]